MPEQIARCDYPGDTVNCIFAKDIVYILIHITSPGPMQDNKQICITWFILNFILVVSIYDNQAVIQVIIT